jgi:carotenoid cleavage dioxygenase
MALATPLLVNVRMTAARTEHTQRWTPKIPPKELKFPTTLAASVCDSLEKAIVWAFDDYGHKKKLPWYEGNYAPTTEMAPASDLPVIGTIPDCMNGEFVRVGTNPQFYPPVSALHWFDGDGMLHGLKMKDGQATYVARYVRTSRLLQEQRLGGPKFSTIGSLRGVPGLFYIMLENLRIKLGVLDVSNGQHTGNTSLLFHSNQLMALNEGDKPYIIKVLEDGDLETIGRESYEGRLGPSMTAHPKTDPVTGELFTYGYALDSPHVHYHVVSKEGVMSEATVITLPKGVLMHDFTITENYAVFLDLPLVLDPEGMVKGNLAIAYDPKKESRLGVLPRYAKDESQMKWFTIPPCYIYHTAGSWEEGDEVVLYACRLVDGDLSFFLDDLPQTEINLYEFRLNLKSGEAKQKRLGDLIVDFPTYNHKYVGRRHTYSYACLFDDNKKGYGVVKYNLQREPEFGLGKTSVGGNVEGLFVHGPGRFGLEAIFVPRSMEPEIAEDDGYLITFVHDENNGTSEAVIIDAKTMAADPVAVVKLPKRVPYGFHSIFMSEEQLRMQSEV